MTYGKASDDSVDYVGMGWQTFFEKQIFQVASPLQISSVEISLSKT